jgi:hypothetical protein
VVGLNAIALAFADEHAFGAGRKFGCNRVASPNKTDEIAFFSFSHKAIALSSYSAQVGAIADPLSELEQKIDSLCLPNLELLIFALACVAQPIADPFSDLQT